MSCFSTAAALVKGAVLSQFGEQMDLFSNNKTTLITNFSAVIHSGVAEAEQFESAGLNAEKTVLKMDKSMDAIVKSGYWVKHGAKSYKLDQPSDPRKYSRGGINTDHFIYWYLVLV